MKTSELKQLFGQMKEGAESRFFGFRDFDIPLDVLRGLRHGMPSLVILCESEPPRLDSSLAVRVEVVKHGSSWRLYLTETDDQFDEPFCSFCLDLLTVMDKAIDERTALSRMEARYEVWTTFWKAAPKMTEEKIRGLVGELLFLEKCLDEGRSGREVIWGWHGTSGSDQDFVFENAWVEVKTVRQSADEVKISSLDQLSNPLSLQEAPCVDGRLVVIRLHDDPAENAFTLSELYKRILKRLEGDPSAQRQFNTDIELVGADMEYGKLETTLQFNLIDIRSYAANAQGFPKLIRNIAIPDAITRATYCLSLAALQDWLIEENSHGE